MRSNQAGLAIVTVVASTKAESATGFVPRRDFGLRRMLPAAFLWLVGVSGCIQGPIRETAGLAMAEYARGVRARVLGDDLEAERRFRRAAEFDPYSSRVLLELGRSLLRLDRPVEAVGALRTAQALEPGAGMFELAYAYAVSGNDLAAIDCFREIHRFDPLAREPVYQLHCLLLTSGRLEEGLELFEELADELSPHWAFASEALGDFLLRSGQLEDAEDRYEDSLRLGGSRYSLQRKLELLHRKRLLTTHAADDSSVLVPGSTRAADPGIGFGAAPPALD